MPRKGKEPPRPTQSKSNEQQQPPQQQRFQDKPAEPAHHDTLAGNGMEQEPTR